MIPRYSRSQMVKVWNEENKFKIWLDIECHACIKMSELGIIPKQAAQNIKKNAKFNISRISKIEKETKHDVIAFLTNLAENIGEDSRFLHKGMTSSDVIDTALSIQLKQASEIIIEDLKKILKILKKKAYFYKYTPMIGRSHGVHAETITFGLKLAGFYSEFKRNLDRMKVAKNEISICALSGPVGTFANIDPRIEKYVAEKFGLKIEPISTQIIPRDRHAVFFSTLGIIASSIERLATEIRNLQRTEILEVEEFFDTGQKGSSAMPHKKNPILSENLTGISRYIRSNVIPSLENITLWHERDISHSSVERIIGPDTTIAIDFALFRLENILKNLIVNKKRMKENIIKLKGLNNSQEILLALVEQGLSREKAYKIVQKASLDTLSTNKDFSKILQNNKICLKKIGKTKIEKILKNDNYKKNINIIFKRVFNQK